MAERYIYIYICNVLMVKYILYTFQIMWMDELCRLTVVYTVLYCIYTDRLYYGSFNELIESISLDTYFSSFFLGFWAHFRVTNARY